MSALQKRHLPRSGRPAKAPKVLFFLGLVLVVVFGSALDSPSPCDFVAALMVVVGFIIGAAGIRAMGITGQWDNGDKGQWDNGDKGIWV